MAREIRLREQLVGDYFYFQVYRPADDYIWNGAAFEAYSSGNYGSYDNSLAVVDANGSWFGTFPASIPTGEYDVRIRKRNDASIDEDDDTYTWITYYHDTTYGQINLSEIFALIATRATYTFKRGVAVSDFPFNMYDNVNHQPLTTLTPANITCQVSKDGASFADVSAGALASRFAVGNGAYALNLEDEDTDAAVLIYRFTATGADETKITILTEA